MGVIGFPTLSSVQTAGPLYFPLEGGGPTGGQNPV